MKSFPFIVGVAVGAEHEPFCTHGENSITHSVDVSKYGGLIAYDAFAQKVKDCQSSSGTPVFGGFQLVVDNDGIFPNAKTVQSYLEKSGYWKSSYDGANLSLENVSLPALKELISGWKTRNLALTMDSQQWQEFGAYVNAKKHLFTRVFFIVKGGCALSKLDNIAPVPQVDVSIISQEQASKSSKKPSWVKGYAVCGDADKRQVCRDYNY